MKHIKIIDKNDLKNYKTMELCCENLEFFSFTIEYVLDLNIVFSKMENRKAYVYESNEGFIKLSSKIQNLISSDVDLLHSNIGYQFKEEDFKLVNRIPKHLDITWITLIRKDGIKININIPYDPVESNFNGITELSNCHSFEINESNDMIIKFGNLSTTPKRENLSFCDIIENWNILNVKWNDYYIDIDFKNCVYEEIDGVATATINMHLNFSKKQNEHIIITFEEVTEYEEDIDDLNDDSYFSVCKLADGRCFCQIGHILEFKFKKCYLERLLF